MKLNPKPFSKTPSGLPVKPSSRSGPKTPGQRESTVAAAAAAAAASADGNFALCSV